MKTTSLSFIESKESRVTSMNQEVIDTTSVAVRSYKVGNIYRYANHTFAVWAKGSWKNETTGKVSNHVVFAVTFDGGAQEYYLDSEGIKQKIGDERRAVRAASMDSNGKATKVKRTVDETAAQIQTKYADTIKNVRDKVGKLQDDARITSALNLLCTMIETAAAERIENITNAEKAKRAARLQRVGYLSSVLPKLQLDAVAAMQDGDFERAVSLGNDAKEMQAELLLLQQEESAYIASLASEESEESEEETETTAENVSEQPAEE